MSQPDPDDRFYDLLFELSNDIRHNILLLLMQKPERMTQIAKMLNLTSPEISRHLTRLSERKLIEKNSDNYYSVTNFGEYFLNSLVDLEFMTQNMDYFLSHKAINIPIKFQKRMAEVSEFRLETNFMNFINFVDEKIEESSEYVALIIDQFPQFARASISSALERGVKFRVIVAGDDEKTKESFGLKHMVARAGEAPVLEFRKGTRNDIYMFLSDKGSSISFPTSNGIDYTGFLSENESDWGRELFEYYWAPSDETQAQCSLCLNPIKEGYIIEVIDGKELVFDTDDCVQTYKQLKQVYGEYFN